MAEFDTCESLEEVAHALNGDDKVITLSDLTAEIVKCIPPQRLARESKKLLDLSDLPPRLRADIVAKSWDVYHKNIKATEQNEVKDDDFMQMASHEMLSVIASQFRFVSLPGSDYGTTVPADIAKAIVRLIKEVAYSENRLEIADLIKQELMKPEPADVGR